MFKDYQNLSIFNAQNPDMIAPRSTPLFPFPFENLDEELAELYVKMNVILTKFEAAKINPTNDTDKRLKAIESMSYKIETAKKLVKNASTQLQTMTI